MYHFCFQHSTEICSNYKPVAIGSTGFQNVVGTAFMIDVSNLLYFTIGRLRRWIEAVEVAGGMCKEGKRNIENLLFAVENRETEGTKERRRAVD